METAIWTIVIFGAILVGAFALWIWAIMAASREVEKYYGQAVPFWLIFIAASFSFVLLIMAFFPQDVAKFLKSMDS